MGGFVRKNECQNWGRDSGKSGKFGNFAGANLVIGTIEVSTKGRISNVANLNVKDLDFSGIPTGGGSVVAGRLYKESNNLIFIKT